MVDTVKIFLALIELRFSVQYGKQITHLAHAFGSALKKYPARFLCIVKQGKELLLQVRSHIYQKITATDKIEP